MDKGEGFKKNIRFIKIFQMNLFRIKAIPDPDFKYFSKLKALYLSLKAR